MTKTIDREELSKKIDRGDHFKLVETVSYEKYCKAHLPGALKPPARPDPRARAEGPAGQGGRDRRLLREPT